MTSRSQIHEMNDSRILKKWDEIPEWQQDNEYILTYYRPPSYSYGKSFWSVLQIHNETVNIWSHLIGMLLFLGLPLYTFRVIHKEADSADFVVFSTFFYGVACCFLLSSLYHTISNHSPLVAKWGNQLDYLGIVVLIWGATIPSIYYGFLCDSDLQRIYWSNICVLALLCGIATLHPRFRHPTIRPYRSAMYAALGISAVVFVVHGIIRNGWAIQNARMRIDWMILMAALNFMGAIVYAVRIPERLYPTKFDVVGNSHQILHCAVILAGIAHYYGLLEAFNFAHSSAGACASKH